MVRAASSENNKLADVCVRSVLCISCIRNGDFMYGRRGDGHTVGGLVTDQDMGADHRSAVTIDGRSLLLYRTIPLTLRKFE